MSAHSQVLARKYRPQIFDDLIGQEALVQTITNAIKQNRLAQAYMLTGIRGVGKTTSARIIAKGLNCIGEDGKGGMTPNPCGKCKHCIDIANDSHIDVIEIDAASNTGVDNVREIIEGAKYNPVSARYKIYIIDEVHMLSKAAFNALLKTLEEPPERVKFIFATTEIRKVPLTILSRCQRFDLKRIDTQTLANHLAGICQKENKNFSQEALYLIAKAGNGSVRDALSLLDQAITQLPDNPSENDVRKMLGVVDKSLLIDLYTSALNAEMAKCFELLESQYQSGANALSLVQDLLDLTYTLTTIKVAPQANSLNDYTSTEKESLKKLAEQSSMHTLTAYWQLLMKGIQEVRAADNPFQAIEMLLIRMAYMSDIPGPEALLKDIKKNNNLVQETIPAAKSIEIAPAISQPAPQVASTQECPFKTIQDIYKLAQKHGERILAFNIESFVRLVQIKPGEIICSLAQGAPGSLVANLSKFLQTQTHTNWHINVQTSGGEPTLKEQHENSKQQLIQNIEKDSVVQEIQHLFKGAKIEKVKPVKITDESDSSKSDSGLEEDEE